MAQRSGFTGFRLFTMTTRSVPIEKMYACQICDLLFELPELEYHEAAYCPRCNHHITTERPRHIEQALALAFSGLLLLLCSTAYPFLGFATSGQVETMTLLDSATSLFAYDQPLLGIIVFVLIFAGPVLLLFWLIVLLLLLRFQLPLPWLPYIARWVHFLHHWNMVEVFLIGALVSVVKISSMASIQLGFAFWAFIGFTLCTISSVAMVDRVRMWKDIDRLMNGDLVSTGERIGVRYE